MKETKKEKLGLKETIKNIKLTWKYARKQKKHFIWYMIFSIIVTVISAIMPIVMAKQLLRLTDGNFKELIVVSVVVFAVEMLCNVCYYVLNKSSQIFFRESLIDIQYVIARETVNLATKELDNNSSGIFIDRLKRDASGLSSIFANVNDRLFLFLSNIGIIIAVLIISVEMFAFFLIGLTILFILRRVQWQIYFKRDEEHRKINEKNTGLITELVRGAKDIKLLNSSDNFINTVHDKLRESNTKLYEMSRTSRIYNFISGTVMDCLHLIFIILGMILYNNELITIANLVILYMYQDRVYNLLSSLASLIENVKDYNLSARRVFEITENIKFEKEIFGTKKLQKAHGDFEFKNVSFSYNKKTEIIKNLSFKIKANNTYGFVGKSGSGKSTIFSLLDKLYNIDKGDITIDGVSIYDLDRDSLRGNISIIPQTPYIFNFSIRENLSIVKKNMSEKEMIKVCKDACIHDFVMSLPERYETVVGEGGVTLSGGQRQRLAIARALLRKTEIILFDEATSALDNETQKEVQNAINNLKGEYTVLIIAHRLSTIKDCDKIIVIDDGKKISEGTHSELLKTCQFYKKLYNSEITLEE